MSRHSILIVDDHPLVRRGIRGLLQAQPDFQVVGEAADGLTALQLVAHHQPDVVILDLVMPVLGGLELLRELGQSPKRPKTVVLSLHDDRAYVRQAMRLGAAGYVLKHSASTFLVAAVRDALAGKFYSSCPMPGEDHSGNTATARPPVDRSELLTNEERMVLRLLAAGVSEDQIAPQLGRQAQAVPRLCRNIALKFGLQEPGEVRQLAVRWVREN